MVMIVVIVNKRTLFTFSLLSLQIKPKIIAIGKVKMNVYKSPKLIKCLHKIIFTTISKKRILTKK